MIWSLSSFDGAAEVFSATTSGHFFLSSFPCPCSWHCTSFDAYTSARESLGNIWRFFDLEPFLSHFNCGWGHEEDYKTDEGENVIIGDIDTTLEGEGGNPEIFFVVKIESGVDGEWVGVGDGDAEATQISTISRVANEDGSDDEHASSNGEGDDVAGCFFEPSAKGLTTRKGVKEELDGGGNKLDDNHDVAFEEGKKEFETSNGESD